jgi:hypothetical protein
MEQMLIDWQESQKHCLQTSSLPAGTYCYQVISNCFVYSGKIIKIK